MRMIVLCLALATMPVFAAGLSEEQAVRQGLTQPRVSALIEARRGAAEGVAASAGRWENPELEYSEESLDRPGANTREESLWLRQRFNVAGARGLERRAARLKLDGQYARIELERRELIREIRALYYDAVAARRRLDTQSGWHGRLQELVAAVEARWRAGDAARYDALRLRQELVLVGASVLEARARYESAREALFELIGTEPVALTGGLLPPAASASTAQALDDHPTLRALDAEASSAETRGQAARRDAWPDVTVGIGRRKVEEAGIDTDGGLIALGVEVPLFNRSQGESQAADDEARGLRAEASLVRSRLRARVGEAMRLLEVRRVAALELRRQATREDGSLAAIAEAAYAAGEIDVMALIDAHRTELALEREANALAGAAREAYIQLQYLRGQP